MKTRLSIEDTPGYNISSEIEKKIRAKAIEGATLITQKAIESGNISTQGLVYVVNSMIQNYEDHLVIPFLEQCINHDIDSPEIRISLAYCYSRKQAHHLAEEQLKISEEKFNFKSPDILANRASLLLDQKKLKEAKEILDEAYDLNPRHLLTLRKQAEYYILSNNNSLAERFLKLAEAQDINAVPDTLLSIAESALKNDEFGMIEKVLNQLVTHYPKYYKALDLYGRALLKLEKDLPASRRFLILGLRKCRTRKYLYGDISLLYWKLGEQKKSAIYFKKCQKYLPDRANTKWVESERAFYQGDLEVAWKKFKHRIDKRPWLYPENESLTIDDLNSGQEMAMLILGEQGVGDIVMFSQVLLDLKDKPFELIYKVDRRLLNILQNSFPKVRFIEDTPESINIKFKAPKIKVAYIGTLCGLLRPNIASFPTHHGYLKSDKLKTQQLRSALLQESGKKHLVGVTWRSMATLTRKLRTCPLACWKFINELPDICFVNLQFGGIQRELSDFNQMAKNRILTEKSVDLTNDFNSLSALISACDAVVGIDNSVIHFSGALNVKTFVMLPIGHEYRWMTSSDSPWYPTMELMRQTSFQAWDSVLIEVKNRLQQFLMEN